MYIDNRTDQATRITERPGPATGSPGDTPTLPPTYIPDSSLRTINRASERPETSRPVQRSPNVTTTPTTTIYTEAPPATPSASEGSEPLDPTIDITTPLSTQTSTSTLGTPSDLGLWPTGTDHCTTLLPSPTGAGPGPGLASPPGINGGIPFLAIVGIVVAGIAVLMGAIIVGFWACCRWRDRVKLWGQVVEGGDPGESELGWPYAGSRAHNADIEPAGQLSKRGNTTSTGTSRSSLGSSAWSAQKMHMPDHTTSPRVGPDLYSFAARYYAEQNDIHSKQPRAQRERTTLTGISFPLHLSTSAELVSGEVPRVESSGELVQPPPPVVVAKERNRSRSTRGEQGERKGQDMRTAAPAVPTQIGSKNPRSSVSHFIRGYRSRPSPTAPGAGGDFGDTRHPSEFRTYSEYSEHRRRMQQRWENRDKSPPRRQSSQGSPENPRTGLGANSNASSLTAPSDGCSGHYSTCTAVTVSCYCTTVSGRGSEVSPSSCRTNSSHTSMSVSKRGDSSQPTTPPRNQGGSTHHAPSMPPLVVLSRPRPRAGFLPLPRSPREGRIHFQRPDSSTRQNLMQKINVPLPIPTRPIRNSTSYASIYTDYLSEGDDAYSNDHPSGTDGGGMEDGYGSENENESVNDSIYDAYG